MDKPSDKVERVGGLEAKPIANTMRSQLNWSQYRQDLRDFISGLEHNPMMSEQKSEIID